MPFHRSLVVAITVGVLMPGFGLAASTKIAPTDETSRFVTQYALALTHSHIEQWAAADLGCLSRATTRLSAKAPHLPAEVARQCWDDTLNAHATLVAQQAESGVFSATGRGIGLGLLHDRHRASEMWKDYPPAVFLSPPVILRDHAPLPRITVAKATPAQPIALLHLKGAEPVTVQGQAVDVTITYEDPLTAPLALRPEEIWWVNGAQRHFGPVREVVARFIVVSGLRKYGYAIDRAVMNEALSGVPLIPATHYGLRPDAGRRSDAATTNTAIVKGELLPGSPKWWERTEAESHIRTAIGRATHLSANERASLLTRLLLLDPEQPAVHAMRGDDGYQAFLKQGITKGGLAARDEAALQRIAELYWTIQAQTWRQELTAVSEGYEPAADSLYRTLASYEALAQQQRATVEQRRRLGALTRWNNDPRAALEIHEPLLQESQPNTADHGRFMTEVAWDRIQWVSWERRYDHPWLQQAGTEAEQAAKLVTEPYDKLAAHYAQAAVESLVVPRNLERFQSRLQQVKQDLDHIAGIKGLQGQLLANDLVKALTPDAAAIVLPTPPRSLEVLDVAVHANPPKQDIVWQWNFDQDQAGIVPSGFTDLMATGTDPSPWQIQPYQDISASTRRFVHSTGCATAECIRLLVAEQVRTTYPDATVQVGTPAKPNQGEAGIAMAVRDARNYYAVTLNPLTGQVTTRRVTDGTITILGQVTAKLANQPWHSLRVQRINFLHLDKGRLAVYVDGAQVAAVEDAVLPQEGRVGLIAIGQGEAQFDGLHLLDLVSNRTFSKPAAY